MSVGIASDPIKASVCVSSSSILEAEVTQDDSLSSLLTSGVWFHLLVPPPPPSPTLSPYAHLHPPHCTFLFLLTKAFFFFSRWLLDQTLRSATAGTSCRPTMVPCVPLIAASLLRLCWKPSRMLEEGAPRPKGLHQNTSSESLHTSVSQFQSFARVDWQAGRTRS